MDIVSLQISVQLLVWCLPSKIYPQQPDLFIKKKKVIARLKFFGLAFGISKIKILKLKLSNRSLALIFEGQKSVEQEINLVWPNDKFVLKKVA